MCLIEIDDFLGFSVLQSELFSHIQPVSAETLLLKLQRVSRTNTLDIGNHIHAQNLFMEIYLVYLA